MMYFVVGGDSAVDSRAGRAADDPDLLCCYQDHRKAQLNKLIWLSLSFFFSPLRKFERSGQAQLCQVALWASACMYLHAIQSESLQTQRSDGRTGLVRTHSDNRDRTPNVAQTHGKSSWAESFRGQISHVHWAIHWISWNGFKNFQFNNNLREQKPSEKLPVYFQSLYFGFRPFLSLWKHSWRTKCWMETGLQN